MDWRIDFFGSRGRAIFVLSGFGFLIWWLWLNGLNEGEKLDDRQRNWRQDDDEQNETFGFHGRNGVKTNTKTVTANAVKATAAANVPSSLSAASAPARM